MSATLEITTVAIEVSTPRHDCAKCSNQLGTQDAPQHTGVDAYCHVCRWLLRLTTARPAVDELAAVGHPGPDSRDWLRRSADESPPARVLPVEKWPEVHAYRVLPSARYDSTLAYFRAMDKAIAECVAEIVQ